MHAVFLIYGKKEWVDVTLRDIAAQKLSLRMHKDGEKDIDVYVECQLRLLPFGFYEFIFPREHKDIVCTTMGFHIKDPSSYSAEFDATKEISVFGFKFKPLDMIRKFLKLEEPKDFNTDKSLLWTKQFVGIIPVGIREDKDITEPAGSTYEGYTHEGI